jgi:hypothetical protein
MRCFISLLSSSYEVGCRHPILRRIINAPDRKPLARYGATLRHTALTWLALEGVDVYEILRFGGITMEVFENVYAHHHPDHMKGVAAGFNRHRNRHRNIVNGREQTPPNVAKIADYSRGD